MAHARHYVARIARGLCDADAARCSRYRQRAADTDARLQALDRMAVLRACARMPAMTLALTWRIHWHALRLWLKRVPFFSKPAPPDAFSSRGAPMP